MPNYEKLKKTWAAKGYKLPELPKDSPLQEMLFKKLDPLNRLQSENLAIRRKIWKSDDDKRGIINRELDTGYYLYQGEQAKKQHSRLLSKKDKIYLRATDFEAQALSVLSETAIQTEINRLEQQKKDKNLEKENETKANNAAAIERLKAEIVEIDKQIKQMQDFLVNESKALVEVKQVISKFVQEEVRDGLDPKDLVEAQEKNSVAAWAKGKKNPTLLDEHGNTKSSRKYKVNGKEYEAEYEDSKKGTTSFIRRKYMKKPSMLGIKNERWGRKERLARIESDYRKYMDEGHTSYSLDSSYENEQDSDIKKWQEKFTAEFADHVRKLANAEVTRESLLNNSPFKDDFLVFDGSIKLLEKLPVDIRTSGYSFRLRTMVRANNQIHTSNVSLKSSKLDQINRLFEWRAGSQAEQMLAAKSAAIIAKDVAILARNSIAKELNKVRDLHLKGVGASARALEDLRTIRSEAQQAGDSASIAVQNAREEFNHQETMFHARYPREDFPGRHPEFEGFLHAIEQAEEKLLEANLALTRLDGVIGSMTVTLSAKNQAKVRDAVTPRAELIAILAPLVAENQDSVTKLAEIIVDAEVLDPPTPEARAARLAAVKVAIRQNLVGCIAQINLALARNPEATMHVLNLAHANISNRDIAALFKTVPGAGAGLVSLSQNTADKAAGVLARNANNVSARAVVTHGNAVSATGDVVPGEATKAAVRVLQSTTHEASAAQVLLANAGVGSNIIAGDTASLLAILRVSQASRNVIADDDASVLTLLKVSEEGRRILANDNPSCAAIAGADPSGSADILAQTVHSTSAAAVLLASDTGLAHIATNQDSFLGLMRASVVGRGVFANNRDAFVRLMRASEAGRQVIANDVTAFKVLMGVSQVGRLALAVEIARAKPDSVAKLVSLDVARNIVMHNESSRFAAVRELARNKVLLNSAAFDLICKDRKRCESLITRFPPSPFPPPHVDEDNVEMAPVGNPMQPDVVDLEAEIRRIWIEHPNELIVELTDKQQRQVLDTFFSAGEEIQPIHQQMVEASIRQTYGAAILAVTEIHDGIVTQFLATASDAEIIALSEEARAKATDLAFDAPVGDDSDLVANAMVGERLARLRNRATDAAVFSDDGLVFNADDSLNATRTAIQDDQAKALTFLRDNDHLKGALQVSITNNSGGVTINAGGVTPEAKLAVVTGVLNHAHGRTAVERVQALGNPLHAADHVRNKLQEVTDLVFNNDAHVAEAREALVQPAGGGIALAVRKGATSTAFNSDGVAAVTAVRDANAGVFNFALTDALSHDHGSAFDAVTNGVAVGAVPAPQTRTKMLADSLQAKNGSAIDAAGIDPGVYSETLQAVIALPDANVKNKVTEVLAMRSPASIAANNAIDKLADFVVVDDDAKHALAEILAEIRGADRAAAITNSIDNGFVDHATAIVSIKSAIAANPAAAIAALNSVYASLQDPGKYTTALFSNLISAYPASAAAIRAFVPDQDGGDITADNIHIARQRNPDAARKAIEAAIAVANPSLIADAIDKHPAARAAVETQAALVDELLDAARASTQPDDKVTGDLADELKKLHTAAAKASPGVAFAAKRIVKALYNINNNPVAAVTPEMGAAMVAAHPEGIVDLIRLTENEERVEELAAILVAAKFPALEASPERNRALAEVRALINEPTTTAATITDAYHADAAGTRAVILAVIPAGKISEMAEAASKANPVGAFKNAKDVAGAAVAGAVKDTITGGPSIALSDAEIVQMAEAIGFHQNSSESMPGFRIRLLATIQDPLAEIDNSPGVVAVRNQLVASDSSVIAAEAALLSEQQRALTAAEGSSTDRDPLTIAAAIFSKDGKVINALAALEIARNNIRVEGHPDYRAAEAAVFQSAQEHDAVHTLKRHLLGLDKASSGGEIPGKPNDGIQLKFTDTRPTIDISAADARKALKETLEVINSHLVDIIGKDKELIDEAVDTIADHNSDRQRLEQQLKAAEKVGRVAQKELDTYKQLLVELENPKSPLGRLLKVPAKTLEAAEKKASDAAKEAKRLKEKRDVIRGEAQANIIVVGASDGAVNPPRAAVVGARPIDPVPRELITEGIINNPALMAGVVAGTAIQRARAEAYVRLINEDRIVIVARATDPVDAAAITTAIAAARQRIGQDDPGVKAAREAALFALSQQARADVAARTACVRAVLVVAKDEPAEALNILKQISAGSYSGQAISGVDKNSADEILKAIHLSGNVRQARNAVLDKEPECLKAWAAALDTDLAVSKSADAYKAAEKDAKKAEEELAQLKTVKGELPRLIAHTKAQMTSLGEQVKTAGEQAEELKDKIKGLGPSPQNDKSDRTLGPGRQR